MIVDCCAKQKNNPKKQVIQLNKNENESQKKQNYDDLNQFYSFHEQFPQKQQYSTSSKSDPKQESKSVIKIQGTEQEIENEVSSPCQNGQQVEILENIENIGLSSNKQENQIYLTGEGDNTQGSNIMSQSKQNSDQLAKQQIQDEKYKNINQDSKIYISNTMSTQQINNRNLGSQITHSMQKKYIKCVQCNLEICRDFIALPCLHQFCFQCLNKVITQQFQKKALFLLCICGKRLKTQMLNQLFQHQQSAIIKENLFTNQLMEIESNLTQKWSCQQCEFFCILKEPKHDRLYCPNCLQYYKY